MVLSKDFKVSTSDSYLAGSLLSVHCTAFIHSNVKRHNIHSPCAGGGVPNILHQVSVPVIDNLSCQEMFNSSGHKKTIRDSFLCAGYKDGKKDSCEVSLL